MTARITKVRLMFMAAILAVLLVAASCGQGGTYQGGSDSVPHYRR